MGHFVFFINLVINNTRIDTAMASRSTSRCPNVVQQKYNSKKTKLARKIKWKQYLYRNKLLRKSPK